MLRLWRPKRWSKVIVTVVLATLLVLAGTIYFLGQVTEDSRDWARDNLPLLAQVTLDRVVDLVSRAQDGVQRAARALRPEDPSAATQDVLRYVAPLELAAVADSEGRLVALCGRREIGKAWRAALRARYPQLRLTTISDDTATTTPLPPPPDEAPPLGTAWPEGGAAPDRALVWEHEGLASALYGQPAESAKAPSRYALRIAARVGEHTLFGWVLWPRFQALLDRVNQEMDQEGKRFQSGYLFLLQQEGDDFRVIGHKDLGIYDRLVNRIDPALVVFTKAMLARETVIEYEYPANTPKTSGLAYREFPGLALALGAGINHEDIFQTSITLRRQAVMLVALVVLLAALSSVFLVRMLRTFRISVDQLTKSAEAMAAGNFPEHVEVADQAELGRLAGVVEQMAERLRQRHALTQSIEMPFQEIRPNPYIVGNPIRDDSMFFGRREELAFARERLQGQSGVALVFCGERRSGKTSILWQLRQGALGERFRPALIDFQALEASGDEEELFLALREMIEDDVPEAEDLDTTTGQNPIMAFRRLIEIVQGRLGDGRLVLLFDEYEILDKMIAEGRVSASVISVLSSLLERSPPVSMVFTGSRPIKDRRNEVWEPLLMRSIYRWVGFLSEEEARDLCTAPVVDRVNYDFGVLDRILRLTSGQPYYTQVICQSLVDHLNRARRNLADKPALGAVVAEVLDAPPPQMSYFWQKALRLEERFVLALLAELLESGDDAQSADAIVRHAASYTTSFEVNRQMVTGILTHLQSERFLAQRPAGVCFRMDLFRLFIRKSHPAWQVLKEDQSS